MKKYQIEIELSEDRIRSTIVKASDKTRALMRALNELKLSERDNVLSVKIIWIESQSENF